MDYQNYLYLEYRRAIRKFRKLQTRFEKRIANNTFQELTARRRHKLISQLNKLKQKIEQLTSRLKLAAAGGSLAFTMALALDSNEAQAQGVPGVPKILSIDRTQANDLTTGFQQDPAIAYNNEGNFAVVWEGDDGDLRGKAYGGNVDESLNFDIPADAGNNSNPAIAVNDQDEFVVTWQESAFAIKYMRYEVEDGVLTSDGPHTATPGAESVHDPDVTLDDNGNFVITWAQNNGVDPGIKARYYTASNVSNGVLDVTDNTNYDQDTPSVDMDNEGNFIVVWKDQEEPDPIVDLIRAQKYNKDTPVGDIVEIVQENENQIYTPDVDLNGDGSFVVAWENAANPGTTEYVRARMFDSAGTATTSEISVGNRAYVSDPVVAADKDGGFVVAYSSYFDSYDNGILGSRYNRFGDVIESFQFHDHNEMYSSSYSGEPAIAMNDRGDFMVAWTDDAAAMGLESGDDEDTGVYFQQYKGKENEPYCLKEENQVNSYSTSNQFSPSIDVDASGNYVVVWEGDWFTSYENARGIIAQRYNSDGTKIGSEFQVNTTTDGNQQQPDIAMDSDGDFIVVWRSYDSYQMGFDLHAQMFNADGSKNGAEFEIDQTEPVYGGPSEPSVDINDDGDAVVVWQSYGPQNIYARVITGPDDFLSNEFQVDVSTVTGSRSYPDVAMNDDRSFVVTWGAPVSGGEEQTFIRRYDSNASALDANDVRISSNYNTQVRKQSIAMDLTNGDFTVAFSEYFNSNNRILASKYNSGGTSVFEEKVITESAYTLHNPHIASNSNGDFAISWDDYSSGKGVAFTVFDSDDEEIYGWDQIQNNATSDQHSGPTIALDDDSNAIVLYGNNSGGYNIFSKTIAQPLKGNIDAGIEFIVNSKTTKDQTNPDIAQNADGDFVVVWLDSYAASFAEYEIKAQRYNNKGIRQGAEMVINNETGQTAENPSVALTDDGDFMVVWSAFGSTGGESYDILGSVFDWAGNEIKDDFILNDVTTVSQRYPDVAVNPDGDFQVIWSDRSTYTENSILGQLVSADGIPDAGGNEILAGITESYESIQASIAINNDGDMAIPYIYNYDGVTNGFFVLNSSLQTLADNLAFGESSYVDGHRPSVTSNEDGDFVIAWSEYDLGNSIYELKVRKYVSGGEFDAGPVTIDVLNDEVDPSIAAVDDGDFVISYAEDNGGRITLNDINLRRISSDLDPIGPEIKISEIRASNSLNNGIASSPNGRYTIVWQSSYADGSDEAIMARQFVSHKPFIDNQGLTIDEGTESDITSTELSFSNPYDNDNSAILTVSLLPTKGILKLDGSTIALAQELNEDDMKLLSYEHDGSETTSDLFTFSVANADFETNNYTFSITINPVNDEPNLTANNGLQLDEGDSQSLYETLAVSDPDNSLDEVTYTIVTLPEHGTLTRDGQVDPLGVGDTFTQEEVGFGNIAYNNDGSESSTDSFEFTLSDLESTSGTQQYLIEINPVNDAPTLANPIADAMGTVGTPFSLTLENNVFNDVDGDGFTLSATLSDDSALPTWLSFDTNTFSGTPDTETTYTIKVTANDGDATVSDEFILTINAANNAPTVANPIPDQAAAGSTAFSYTVPANTFSDAESSTLTLSANLSDGSDLPDWLSFDAATGTFSGTTPLDPNFDTSILIQVTASDGEASVSDEFTLTVASVLTVNNQDLDRAQLYPNPVEQTLHLKPEASMMGAIQVYIFKESGKIVETTTIYKTYQTQVFEIDVQNLNRGLYFVKMINDNTTATFKMSKE